MEYLIVKWLHVLSATILFGTGLGSAYYMFFASRQRKPEVVAAVVRLVVRADACWLPVVWMQIDLRRMADASLTAGLPLPERYFRLLRAWVALGFPAFGALLVVFWLMIAKPA